MVFRCQAGEKNVCVGCHDISWKVVSGSVSPHICAVDHVAC